MTARDLPAFNAAVHHAADMVLVAALMLEIRPDARHVRQGSSPRARDTLTELDGDVPLVDFKARRPQERARSATAGSDKEEPLPNLGLRIYEIVGELEGTHERARQNWATSEGTGK